jgi:two-component system, chemotaxis family, sensor kinase CheA
MSSEVLGRSFESLLEGKTDAGLVLSDDQEFSEPEGTADLVSTNEVTDDVESVTVDDGEILFSFIEESREHLENIEEKILSLEKGIDTAIVDEIFRSMHTMKGTSSFLGLESVRILSHRLEELLDDLRSDKITIGAELVDILLAGSDCLKAMVEQLNSAAKKHSESSGAFEIQLTGINIGTHLKRIDSIRSDDTKSEPQPQELITPELLDSFQTETSELIERAESSVLELEKNGKNKSYVDDAFRAIHTIKGNAGFVGFPEFEAICMEVESVLDGLRTGKKHNSANMVTALLGSLDSMRKLLAERQQDVKATPEDNDHEYKPIGELLIEMGEVSTDDVEEAVDIQERRIGEILIAEGKVNESTIEKALSSQQKAEALPAYRTERKDIRVDMGKLDKMFDLMGELITAEAMVIHNPELSDLELESFTSAGNYLSKITREMQEITMAVRMIPMDGLFNKMRRLVRDLSRKFGKNINFETSGQETEMDRNVMETISDPLVHIIRNGIDHGIEDTQVREAAGKPPDGKIALSAKYEGNEIWITIADDGGGMNREMILDKAVEKELLKGDRDTLSDEEVWQLVFEPGFSTALKVSEISGRGVGMDVVKKNMEKLRGKIDIISVAEEGSDVILKIPLTLAIIDGITAKVGGVLYALPLGDILEFHKAEPVQVTRTDTRREVLKLRDEILPIVKLYEFFEMDAEKRQIDEGIVIIVQAAGKKIGVLVDEIVGYQQIVVKGLPEYLGSLRAISGCSILGNGDVALIVDASALVREEFI